MTNKKKRRARDLYPTCPDAVEALLWFIHSNFGLGSYLPGDGWLEPAAGDGILLHTMERQVGGYWTAIEPDVANLPMLEDTDAEIIRADAIERSWPDDVHVVTNPPYSLAEAFAMKMAEHAARNATWHALLLRAGFWLAARRKRVLEVCAPDYLVGLSWRPSFTGDGGNDWMGAEWAVWTPEDTGDMRYRILDRPQVPRKLWRLWELSSAQVRRREAVRGIGEALRVLSG